MQSQMNVPPLSKVNKTILIVYVSSFVLGTILKMSTGIQLEAVFGLSFTGLKSGLIFQLLTYPFVGTQLMSVVFNGLILWFIGSELEEKWGRIFYLKFLGVATYSCGLIYILLTVLGGELFNFMPLFGLTGTNLALLVAYGIIYSERTMIFMFLFPMKAKYFCLLLGAIEMFMALTASAFNSAWAHLISMVTGYSYLKYQSLRARGLGVGQILENHKQHKAKAKRSKLRLVKSEEDKANPENPKYWQ